MSIFNFNSPWTIGNPKSGNAHKIEKYESPLTPLSGNTDSNNTFDVTGIFSGMPDIVTVRLECTGASTGYVPGDVIFESTFHLYDSSSASAIDRGVAVSIDKDLTTITCTIAEDAQFISKSTLNLTSDNTNWSFKIKALRFVIGDQPDITRVGLVPLERKVVSSGDADVQFNLQQYFQEYETFRIEYIDASGATDTATIILRCSTDGGSTFDSSAVYQVNYQGIVNTATSESGASTNDIRLSIQGTGTADSRECVTGHVDIANPQSTVNYSIFTGMCSGISDASQYYFYSYDGSYGGSKNQLTNVQILPSTGNFEKGTFILYGKRKVA